jgi:Fe-S cluster assembly scaffold protein SufB
MYSTESLHAACWSGGSLLVVPKGLAIERPLGVLSAMSPDRMTEDARDELGMF